MGEKILFAVKNKLGMWEHEKIAYLNSQYLLNYKKNRESIQRKSAWKTQGMNAAFRGDSHPMQNVDLEAAVHNASINGVAFSNKGDKIVYSVTVEDFSGVFIKNPADDGEDEGHVIHDNRVQFLNFDCHPSADEIVISIQQAPWERNIAILNLENTRYRMITEGESFDENPVWDRNNPRIIYYESAGIGRTRGGQVAGFGPKSINRLDLGSGELREIFVWPQYDGILPKIDMNGNVYFIRKPYQSGRGGRVSLKEILLIPVKLVKALYGWIDFFTIKHTGEPLTSAGGNPSKAKQPDMKEILINGNIINAEKTLKENSQKGEKYPGIAPRSWELMVMGKDGEAQSIKKGVLDYDIAPDGSVVLSNGKFIIRLERDGREEIIERVELAGKIKVIGKC